MEETLRQYIRNFIREIIEDEELEEVTATGNVDGYGTPNAFADDSEESKEKERKNSTNSTGYSIVKEAITKDDIVIIKKSIRDVISDVYRDIWLKRNSWK